MHAWCTTGSGRIHGARPEVGACIVYRHETDASTTATIGSWCMHSARPEVGAIMVHDREWVHAWCIARGQTVKRQQRPEVDACTVHRPGTDRVNAGKEELADERHDLLLREVRLGHQVGNQVPALAVQVLLVTPREHVQRPLRLLDRQPGDGKAEGGVFVSFCLLAYTGRGGDHQSPLSSKFLLPLPIRPPPPNSLLCIIIFGPILLSSSLLSPPPPPPRLLSSLTSPLPVLL